MKTLNQYQETIGIDWHALNDPVVMDHPIVFPTLALAGEVGELAAEHIGRLIMAVECGLGDYADPDPSKR
jgi:hypothetical protein